MKHLTPPEFTAMLKAAGDTYKQRPNKSEYLTRPDVADRLGVVRGTLNRYRLPPPDVQVGDRPGWLPATIDAWDAARPSRRNKV